MAVLRVDNIIVIVKGRGGYSKERTYIATSLVFSDGKGYATSIFFLQVIGPECVCTTEAFEM
jgi:hypothetical protein